MNGPPAAAGMVSEGVSRICDLAGVVLLIVLGWQMFFEFDSALQTPALVVGLVGLVAAWTDQTARQRSRWPLFMFAYVGIALTSSIVHQWATVMSARDANWTALFEPAFHLVVMTVFVSGAAYLLRTERRLSVFVVLFVGAVVISAAQMVFDRAVHDRVYVRAGTVSFPSIPQWGGVHGNSLVLTLGLPLALSISQSARPALPFAAGICLWAALVASAYVNGSRAGLVTMALITVVMGALVLHRRVRHHARKFTPWAFAAATLIVVAWALWSRRTSIGDFGGRGTIWRFVAALIGEHPWLGVGPGQYAQGMREGGYAAILSPSEGVHNAHNLLLHVGAEIGVAGMLCLLAFLIWMVRACYQAWTARQLPMVSLGVCCALVGFLLHSASEDFLDARADVERTRLIVWMCFGAALAVARLPRSASTAS